MTVYKEKQLKTMKLKFSPTEPVHTPISFIMAIMALIIMLYFGIRHLTDETIWAKSAFMQFGFVFLGLFGTQLLAEQPLIPTIPSHFRKVEIQTGIRAILIAFLGMAIQLISKVVMSFTLLEQAVYFVFSAISEEIFFRGFLMGLFLKFDSSPQKFSLGKITGVLVQAVAFSAIHQNYYNDFPMLLSTFIGGLMLGLMYLLWEDLTANVLGHFIINVIAVQNLLVML